jgi:hypothetical protein
MHKPMKFFLMSLVFSTLTTASEFENLENTTNLDALARSSPAHPSSIDIALAATAEAAWDQQHPESLLAVLRTKNALLHKRPTISLEATETLLTPEDVLLLSSRVARHALHTNNLPRLIELWHFQRSVIGEFQITPSAFAIISTTVVLRAVFISTCRALQNNNLATAKKQWAFLNSALETAQESEKGTLIWHVSTLFKERLLAETLPKIIVCLYEEWELLTYNHPPLLTIYPFIFNTLKSKHEAAKKQLISSTPEYSYPII